MVRNLKYLIMLKNMVSLSVDVDHGTKNVSTGLLTPITIGLPVDLTGLSEVMMTDKVDCAIWIWDNELQRKKRIRLQTLLNRVNHTLRDENQTYFALEKDRNKFAKECKT